jgi:hypothetical protein
MHAGFQFTLGGTDVRRSFRPVEAAAMSAEFDYIWWECIASAYPACGLSFDGLATS